MALKIPYRVPPSVVTESFKPFFKSYDYLDGIRPSSWIVWKDDGKAIVNLGEACHANMQTQGTGWDHLITAVPNDDPISLAYQRMLINGPFRGVSDMILLDRVPNKYFIHCTDLDKWPSNLLYNYCIATRVPIEHAELLPLWSELTLEGYDPTLAFLLSYTTTGQRGADRDFDNLNHFWFDASSDWTRIIKGNPTRLSRMFKTNPAAVTPCNVLWGKSEGDWVKIEDMTNEQIAEFYGLPIEPYVKPEKPDVYKVLKKLYGGAPIGHHGIPLGINAVQPAEDAWVMPGDVAVNQAIAHLNAAAGHQAGMQQNPAAEILINPHGKWNILDGGIEINPEWQVWHDAHPKPNNDPFAGFQFANAAQQEPQPEVFDDDDNDEGFFDQIDEDDGDFD